MRRRCQGRVVTRAWHGVAWTGGADGAGAMRKPRDELVVVHLLLVRHAVGGRRVAIRLDAVHVQSRRRLAGEGLRLLHAQPKHVSERCLGRAEERVEEASLRVAHLCVRIVHRVVVVWEVRDARASPEAEGPVTQCNERRRCECALCARWCAKVWSNS